MKSKFSRRIQEGQNGKTEYIGGLSLKPKREFFHAAGQADLEPEST